MTPQDILTIVLSFSILWTAVFLCWLMYHCVSVLRAVEVFLRDLRERAERIDNAIRGVKDRLEHSVSHLGVIGDAIKHLTSYFLDGKKKKKDEE